MPGRPLCRARQNAVIRAEDGSVIAFPRLTHPRAGLSHAEWRTFGPAEKIERQLDMSLDRVAEILSWGPTTELDPVRSSIQMQVWRVVFMIGVKALLNGRLDREIARERDGQRILDRLIHGLDERATRRV